MFRGEYSAPLQAMRCQLAVGLEQARVRQTEDQRRQVYSNER